MATTTSGKTGLFAFDPARCNAMSDGGAEGNGGAMAGLLRGYFHDDAVRGGSRHPKRQTILFEAQQIRNLIPPRSFGVEDTIASYDDLATAGRLPR